jgi:hypothetical protein
MVITAPGAGILAALAGEYNPLGLGEAMAAGQGVEVARVRRWTAIGAGLASAGVAAVAGPIGFVGLLAPHAVRRWTGPDMRLVLPASFLAGGILLAVCDAAGRWAARAAGNARRCADGPARRSAVSVAAGEREVESGDIRLAEAPADKGGQEAGDSGQGTGVRGQGSRGRKSEVRQSIFHYFTIPVFHLPPSTCRLVARGSRSARILPIARDRSRVPRRQQAVRLSSRAGGHAGVGGVPGAEPGRGGGTGVSRPARAE